MKIKSNGIELEVEDTAQADPGARDKPAVLLIMGLGMQLIAWPSWLMDGLVNAGYRVIRMDNRDVGLSQKMRHLGRPNLLWAGLKYKMGLNVEAPYSLKAMALDAVGVLDALGARQAHVIGVSMGGMIAQRMALVAPERMLSLSSVMSSSGARGLPGPQPEVLKIMMSKPGGRDLTSVVAHYVRLFQAIGSPGFPENPATLRQQIMAAAQRNYDREGTMRQTMAVVADDTRARELAHITTPTLVIHGKADPLVPYACGLDTARRISGARMLGIEGMGHDLPAGVVQHMLPPLLQHLQAAQAGLS